MTWIRTIPPDQANGPAAEAYAKLGQPSSKKRASNIWQSLSLDPGAMVAAFGLRAELMNDPSPLSLAQAEAIVLVVSATNGCAYCVAHHGPKFAAALGNEPLARAVAIDYREADLAARDRVLLDYAVALT